MPKINVVKTVHIKAPVENVFNVLNDFNHWKPWSPWLIMNPNATVNVAADSKSYRWEGDRVGSGHMSITDERKNESLHVDLTFLKPWKSTAKVKFELKPKEGGAEVAWYMDSSLPFFMFFMKNTMTKLIGMDYERGLAMLKDYVEDGEVHSKLNFMGESQYPGCKYIGIKTQTSTELVGPKMESDFKKIHGISEELKLEAGEVFSIYHKYDIMRNKVVYTAGVTVKTVPTKLPPEFISGTIPSTKVYTMEHVGPYAHLGNAWTTLQAMIRNKELKLVKGIHPFETYPNDPMTTPPNDLKTQIHFAVK